MNTNKTQEQIPALDNSQLEEAGKQKMPSLRVNIFIGYLLLAALLGITIFFGFYSTGRFFSKTNALNEKQITKNQLISDMVKTKFEAQLAFERYTMAQTEEGRQQQKQLVKKLTNENRERIDKLKHYATDSAEFNLIVRLTEKRAKLAMERELLFYDADADGEKKRNFLVNRELPAYREFMFSVDSLREQNIRQSRQTLSTINSELKFSRNLLIAFMLFAFIIMAAIGRIIFINNKRLQKRNAELSNSFAETAAYKYALDQSAIITLTDISGNILSANQHFYDVSGYSHSEIKGRNPRIFNSGYHTREFFENMWTTILDGKVWKGEIRNKTKSGKHYWVDTTIVPLKDEDLKVYNFLVIRYDITQRKKAEAELNESESRLRNILNAEPECVKLVDRNGVLIDINPAGLQMMEADSYAQVVGNNCEQMIALEYREEYNNLLQKVFKGESGKLDFESIGLKGKRSIFQTHAVPFRNRENKITAMLGITRDITELRKAHLKLAESERSYRSLIEQAMDAIVISDTQGIIKQVNPKTAELTGYSKEELIGMPLTKLISPDDLEKTPLKIPELLAGKTLINERTIITKNNSAIQVEINSRLIDNNRIMGFVRDITERNKALQAIAESEYKLNEAQRVAKTASWEYKIKIRELKWSKNMYELLGLEAFAVKPDMQELLKLVHPNDKQRMETIYKDANLFNQKEQFRIIDRHGNLKYIEAFVTQQFSKEGNPTTLLGTLQDITDRVLLQQEKEKALTNAMLKLEEKVSERTEQINTQKELIEVKNKEITDSIAYAQRLQNALYPDLNTIKRHFRDVFILNQSRNMVGGDFFWFYRTRKRFYLAAADCTGHGVPGAFMSIIGIQLLNKIIVDQNWEHPSLVLELLDAGITDTLKTKEEETIKDGMDMAFCIIDSEERTLTYSGAMLPLILCSDGQLQHYPASRFGLGSYMDAGKKRFETISINYKPGDMLYLFSDGFRDQFGGEQGKKLGMKKQKELLCSISKLPAAEQKKELYAFLKKWQGNHEQVDDIMMVGLRLS